MNENQTVPHMVTIRKAAELTGVSQYAIRRMCRSGEIVFIKTGTKYLINIDRFMDYLNGIQH